MRWASVQAIDVKFSQDLTHQKSLKLVNVWQSYLKNKKGGRFLGHSVVKHSMRMSVRRKISGNLRKFILIFPDIFGNLLITYVNQLFPSPKLQSDAVK